MNTKKNYYLIISTKNILIKEKMGDMMVADGQKANDIFNQYKIPEEFQKIILKVSVGNFFEPKNALELTTGEMLFFKTSFIKTIINKSENMELMMVSHNTEIYTKVNFYHVDMVKKFYQEIIDAEKATDYQLAVADILDKSPKYIKTKKIIK